MLSPAAAAHAEKFKWLILSTVSTALFMIVVDVTILYTTLPTLTRELGATVNERLWIANIYPLVVAGLLPLSGKLSDTVGYRRMFAIGLAVFGVASLAAAFSPTPEALIAARVGLGLGGAIMMPATLAIIRQVFVDPSERSLAFGVWTSIAAGGMVFGPIIGGVLVEHFWWGSVFLVNVPIVVLTLLAATLIPRMAPAGRGWHPHHFVSSLQAMLGLAAVVLAIKQAAVARAPGWTIVVPAVVGIALLAILVRNQLAAPAPMLNFRLFRDRAFTAGMLTIMIGMVPLIGMEFLFAQYLQLARGFSPLVSALALLPIALAVLVAGPLSGWLQQRVSMQRVATLGLCMMVIGFFMLSFSSITSNGWLTADAMLALALIGGGFGTAGTCGSVAVMASAPAEQAGMAASFEEVAYEMAGVLGMTLFASVTAFNYTANLAGAIDAAHVPAALASLDDALRVAATLPLAEGAGLRAAAQAAYDSAYHSTLLSASVLLTLGAIGLALLWKGCRVTPLPANADSRADSKTDAKAS